MPIMLGVLLVCILASCNRDQPTPTPTPIPAPGIRPTSSSLAVIATTTNLEIDEAPTVQPTSTATPVPATRLARAEEFYRYGDYDAARAELISLEGEEQIDEQLVEESQFLLALSYKEEAQHDLVLETLESLLGSADLTEDGEGTDVLPEGDARFYAQIRMLHADTLNNLARYDEALDEYDQFMAQYPWSTEVVQSKRGAILRRLGNANAAADAYRSAAEVATDPSTIAFFLETVAQIELGSGRNDRAIEAYEGILDIAERPAYRAQIQYNAGNAAATSGDETSAIDFWLATTNESVESSAAHAALVELVNRNIDFNLYQRGLINLENEVWLPAINAFQGYLDSVAPTDKLAGPSMLGLAQAYIGFGNYSTALTVIDNLLESYPDCECVGQAWLEKALAQAWLGDSVGAHRTYRIFARDLPDDPLAAESLWQSGLLAYREGSELEAAADLLTLVDSFPDSERAPLALYLIGLGAFREGFWEQSILFFERMHDEYPETDGAASAYWAGRAYYAKAASESSAERVELEEQARDAWQRAFDAEPGEYYSVLAAVALAQENPTFDNLLLDVPLIDQTSFGIEDDDGSRAFAEEWLAEWLGKTTTIDNDIGVDDTIDDDSTEEEATEEEATEEEATEEEAETVDDNDEAEGDATAAVNQAALGELPPSVLADPDYIQGAFFLSLNQRAEALPILERLLNKHGDDPRTLYALSLAFESMGAYRLSLIAANNLLVYSPVPVMQDRPLFLQQLVFPERFAELVTKEAEEHGIDPPLFFSLIRQESLFEEGARSFAAAQGLAQIIPDTGEWVAERIGFPGYTNELVYRPHINLRFGAYYLDWTREYLNGNTIAALVGYNAGPGNSEGWRNESGADDPLFVEVLTWSEPRIYVQRITSNYYHYLRLYP